MTACNERSAVCLETRKDRLLSKIAAKICMDEAHRFEGSNCWLWTGATSGKGRGGGYGRVSIDGHTCAVHRVIYTHFYGYVPAKRQIDHKCGNRLCCNPDHLQDVTHKQNQSRRATRRRKDQQENYGAE